jgi:hypothetical protein
MGGWFQDSRSFIQAKFKKKKEFEAIDNFITEYCVSTR